MILKTYFHNFQYKLKIRLSIIWGAILENIIWESADELYLHIFDKIKTLQEIKNQYKKISFTADYQW